MMSTIWLETCRGIWKNIINKCIRLQTRNQMCTWLLMKDIAWTLKFLPNDCGFWVVTSYFLKDYDWLSVFPCFCGTRRFITVFICRWNVSGARLFHRIPYFVTIPVYASSPLRFDRHMWVSVFVGTFTLALLCHPIRRRIILSIFMT